jgi:hypothetical protein
VHRTKPVFDIKCLPQEGLRIGKIAVQRLGNAENGVGGVHAGHGPLSRRSLPSVLIPKEIGIGVFNATGLVLRQRRELLLAGALGQMPAVLFQEAE